MRSAHRFFQILQRQVGVELGAGDLCMSQDGLDVSKVHMVAQEVGGHGVANMWSSTYSPICRAS